MCLCRQVLTDLVADKRAKHRDHEAPLSSNSAGVMPASAEPSLGECHSLKKKAFEPGEVFQHNVSAFELLAHLNASPSLHNTAIKHSQPAQANAEGSLMSVGCCWGLSSEDAVKGGPDDFDSCCFSML